MEPGDPGTRAGVRPKMVGAAADAARRYRPGVEYYRNGRLKPEGGTPSCFGLLRPGYHLQILPRPWRPATLGRRAGHSSARERATALASTHVIGRARASAEDSDLKRLATWLIIGAISFNAVLCFLNTRGIAISNVHVILSEALLIFTAAVACRKNINVIHLSIIAMILLYTAALCIIRKVNTPADGFDPKIVRDLLVPVIFFLLGKAVGHQKAADRIVFIATSIVLCFAIFEYFFLDIFLKVFGVAEYYIARGTLVDSDHTLNVAKGLMISGFRPEGLGGRALLPFLGDHRVSSIFLEPISLGNFGTWVTLWAVLRSRMEGRPYIWCALSGLALLILSDARFDAGFLVLGVIVLMLPPRLTTLPLFLLPFLIIIGLYIFAVSAGPFDGRPILEGVGVYDRLLYCGRVLFYLDAYNWFGLETARANVMDAGYAYVLSSVGIIGFAALWILFMSLEGSNPYFYAFRNVMAVYLAALFCISASQFTIKIAALLWFLLGVLSVARVNDAIRSPARDVGARVVGTRFA